ncbi:helitron helicase-like amino-terminal domain protein [Ceratobasidium sp. AG-Ba]|nr:helitron helicase-like amino-terminal domain protein [Ceratobasidium sp. AG-Ba]
MQTGRQLRKLFVLIVTACAPGDATQLWLDFQERLCDDLRHELQRQPWRLENPPEERVYDFGLYLIERLVEDAGLTMQRVNLPRSIGHSEQYNPQNPLIMEQLQLQNDQPPDAVELHHNQLNNEQLAAFDNIYHSVGTKVAHFS